MKAQVLYFYGKFEPIVPLEVESIRRIIYKTNSVYGKRKAIAGKSYEFTMSEENNLLFRIF